MDQTLTVFARRQRGQTCSESFNAPWRQARRWLSLIIVIVGFGLALAPTAANAFVFGRGDYMFDISDTRLTDANNRPITLAHKVSIYAFLLPWWITDDGYVLRSREYGRQGLSDVYFDLPAGRIAELQRSGDLPTPLPHYEIWLITWAMGFSGWIVVGAALIWFGGRYVLGHLRWVR